MNENQFKDSPHLKKIKILKFKMGCLLVFSNIFTLLLTNSLISPKSETSSMNPQYILDKNKTLIEVSLISLLPSSFPPGSLVSIATANGIQIAKEARYINQLPAGNLFNQDNDKKTGVFTIEIHKSLANKILEIYSKEKLYLLPHYQLNKSKTIKRHKVYEIHF